VRFRWQPVRDSNPCRHLESVIWTVSPVLGSVGVSTYCLVNGSGRPWSSTQFQAFERERSSRLVSNEPRSAPPGHP